MGRSLTHGQHPSITWFFTVCRISGSLHHDRNAPVSLSMLGQCHISQKELDMKMKDFDQLSWGSLTPYGITEKQLLMRSDIPSKSTIATGTEVLNQLL